MVRRDLSRGQTGRRLEHQEARRCRGVCGAVVGVIAQLMKAKTNHRRPIAVGGQSIADTRSSRNGETRRERVDRWSDQTDRALGSIELTRIGNRKILLGMLEKVLARLISANL